ncbi:MULTISPECIES: M3 family metallopeptidase [unclassified Rhodanobacter]|uniref:M3 family metallopeptidase n=1 Tax=unclassified Rhodanobacter TaxID=2621553 RepID=UPI0007A9A7C2|nr:MULTISPECIES: M3 family metallopeptidase [unclassified Rhodanobacter]KZC15583.1 oligopeptidase A [Rhodanobacter sp. FW104-R8]KZC27409.1 oligopeptidase A [Rhodanobacter sp. FW510-T8]KZC31988.1 oligopeptidase A [Rhodanobacter sp. FW510-R10]
MSHPNPLLADDALPAFSQIRPEHVEPAIEAILADYRAGIDALVAPGAPRDFGHVMLVQERLEQRLARAWAPVSHLHSVADGEALRKVYGPAEEKLTEHAIELGQNRDLYAAVRALAEAPDFAALSRPERALVEHALRDFKLSGVALEEPARSRFREIGVELSRLSTEFSNAVLDASEAWHEHVTDERDLAGVPESGRAVLRQYAEDQQLDGYLVTLKQPSVQAVLTYADNRSLRERVYWAYQTRASDQGPNAGKFDNSARIERIMALRHEAAQLLGFANAAEESLATKMAASPTEVLEFLHDLAARAKPVAQLELARLREFASAELKLDNLESWDVGYAAEKLRQREYALDEEQLKPYFPLPAVIDGLFGLAGKLYGITLAPRDGVDVWHPEVRYYDVRDAAGRVFAGAYVDLYARNGKRGGAWMDVCRARFDDGADPGGAGPQQPVAFLTCNFAPPTEGKPALLTHDDVLTLFHEFGHGLHHLLTGIALPSIGGIDGVEWDAVELPSQFMENFGWNREALDLFARHWQTGARLPDELFERMLAARHFHAGLFLVRQLEFALFDFLLHLEYDPAQGARALAVLEEVRKQVAVMHPPAWQRFPHGFSHIFAGGYAAGYYSYLWAELLSADAFGAFEEQAGESGSVIDRATGERFRREFLAVGASRPALESFVAFRGRKPEPEALLRSHGLA